MERKIFDMLDAIEEDQIRLDGPCPLSERVIRKRTMDRIGAKKNVRLRWLGRVAAVAAVIMLLTISVIAADVVLGDRKLLGQFFGKELTDEQMEVAEDIGRDFSGSVSSNGTTITPIEAVADEDHMYLHLKVEAPEGVVLRDLPEGYYYSFDPAYSWPTGKYDPKYWDMRVEYYWDDGYDSDNWHRMQCTYSITTLEDEDPTDNVKEFVIRFTNSDGYAIFNGPWEKCVYIQGLFIRKQYDSYCEEVLRGRFAFDIGLHDEDRKDSVLVVDLDGLTIENWEYDYTTTIEKIVITPLSITVKYSHTTPNNKYIFPEGGPIWLVMKDGTTVKVVDAYYDARTYPRPDDVAGVGDSSCFEEIVVLEQIDYILVGGTHRIDVG